MKNLLAIALGITLVGCGGGSSSSAATNSNTSPAEAVDGLMFNANIKGVEYAAFKADGGSWSQIESDEVSLPINEGDNIEFVAICNGEYTVERLKVSKTINLDYSHCAGYDNKIEVEFVTGSDYQIIGLTTNKDSKVFELAGDSAYLYFDEGTNFNSVHLSAVLAEKANPEHFFIINYPNTIIDTPIHTLVVNPNSDLETRYYSNEFDKFPNNFAQIVNLSNGYRISTSYDNRFPHIGNDRSGLSVGSYTQKWDFGTASSFTAITTDQSWEYGEAPVLLDVEPEEISLADANISQDKTEISFVDKPVTIEGLNSESFVFSMADGSHSLSYIIDPSYFVSGNTFTVLDYSTLPGIDSSLIPANSVEYIVSIEANYWSETYPAAGSYKLALGSK